MARMPVAAGALAALGLLLVPGSAGAKDGDDAAAGLKKIIETFATLDANGDGKLSEQELPLKDGYVAVDADRDGTISKEECLRALKLFDGAGGSKKPMAGEEFTAWAKKRITIDPRFNAEARRAQFLENFDRDPKDGKIQRKEYAGADGDKVFRDFDVTKDGALDERELLGLAKDQISDLEKSRRRPNRQNFLVLFDMDDDRRVTRDEYAFLRGPASAFTELDDDADGVVTYEELIYETTLKKNNRGKRREGDAPAEAPPPEKHDVWYLYDKDKDGRVTTEEFAGGDAVFRRLDRNRDGYLTAADL